MKHLARRVKVLGCLRKREEKEAERLKREVERLESSIPSQSSLQALLDAATSELGALKISYSALEGRLNEAIDAQRAANEARNAAEEARSLADAAFHAEIEARSALDAALRVAEDARARDAEVFEQGRERDREEAIRAFMDHPDFGFIANVKDDKAAQEVVESVKKHIQN